MDLKCWVRRSQVSFPVSGQVLLHMQILLSFVVHISCMKFKSNTGSTYLFSVIKKLSNGVSFDSAKLVKETSYSKGYSVTSEPEMSCSNPKKTYHFYLIHLKRKLTSIFVQ